MYDNYINSALRSNVRFVIVHRQPSTNKFYFVQQRGLVSDRL